MSFLKKIVVKLWAARLEFARYFFTGVSAFVLDIGSIWFLTNKMGVSPVMSVVINQAFLLNYVFLINKHWSFKSQGVTHKQVVRFYLLSLVNYCISIGWMTVVNGNWGIEPTLARTSNIIAAVGWNFLIYKYWVYRRSTNLDAVSVHKSSRYDETSS